MTKMYIGEGFVQYGRLSACNEYEKIEEKIFDLGECKEYAYLNNAEETELDKMELVQREEKLLKELRSELSAYNIDLRWMTRFLKERGAYYISEGEKEKAEGKEQVSSSILGQLEATNQVQNIVKELLQEKTL